VWEVFLFNLVQQMEIIQVSIGSSGIRRRRLITPKKKLLPSKEEESTEASQVPDVAVVPPPKIEKKKKRSTIKKRKRVPDVSLPNPAPIPPVTNTAQTPQDQENQLPCTQPIQPESFSPYFPVDIPPQVPSSIIEMPVDTIQYMDLVLDDEFSLCSLPVCVSEGEGIESSLEDKLAKLMASNQALEQTIELLRENQHVLEKRIHHLSKECNAKQELLWQGTVLESLSRSDLFRQRPWPAQVPIHMAHLQS
jgi:hypothetical protein